MNTTDQNLTTRVLDIYNTNKAMLYNNAPAFVNEDKRRALEVFAQKGIPSRKDEKYKYANIPLMMQKHLDSAVITEHKEIDIDQVFHCDVAGLDVHNAVVLNGFYYHKQPPIVKLDNGVMYGSLAAAVREYPELVKAHYGRYALEDSEGMVAMNNIFSRDGVFLYVPDNAVMDKPVQIVNILYDDKDLNASYRNLVIVGRNASASLIICDHTLSPHKFMSNVVTEAYVAENAHFDQVTMQNEHDEASHLSHVFVQQEAGSDVKNHFISLNGGFIRNNLHVSMNGDQCANNAYGFAVADKNQYIDNFVVIRHEQPHGVSNQLFKSILDGKSQVSFNGKIYVARDAQKTNAFQTNRSLLLSKSAKINSKPQLEIYADDVKCSHGATVGKLDEEALFYMRSRGISFSEARLLLMYAFADEVVSTIGSEALRDRVREITDQRLRGELDRCKCCALNCYQPA